MNSEYIYIKLLGRAKTYIKLQDSKNNNIFDGYTNDYGEIKIKVRCNNIYKLIIICGMYRIIVPLYAINNYKYCIPININKKRKSREITIHLKDYNYPDINIQEGEVMLWEEDIPST